MLREKTLRALSRVSNPRRNALKSIFVLQTSKERLGQNSMIARNSPFYDFWQPGLHGTPKRRDIPPHSRSEPEKVSNIPIQFDGLLVLLLNCQLAYCSRIIIPRRRCSVYSV